jgi:transposase-like protein
MLGTVNKVTLEELDRQVLALLEKRAAEAAAAAATAVSQYKAKCPSCRSLHSNYISKTVGSFNIHVLGLRYANSAGFCPKCNRCIYSDES